MVNILVLNGNPRANGNTAAMINAFVEGTDKNDHAITVVDICKKKIDGYLTCEYVIQKAKASVSNRTICRKSILFWKKQR